MAETLRTRVAQIVAGSVHALLDKIEDQAPEFMMEQAVRRIDAVIDEVRAELGKTAANRHLTQSRYAELKRQHLEWTVQAEEAIALNRDDLAKAAIGKQLDVEVQIPVLETRWQELAGQEKDLSAYIDALLAKKREMEAALTQYLASRQQLPGEGALQSSGAARQAAVADAGVSFNTIFRRHTGMTLSDAQVSIDQSAKLKELDNLVQSKKIETRLAELRAGKA